MWDLSFLIACSFLHLLWMNDNWCIYSVMQDKHKIMSNDINEKKIRQLYEQTFLLLNRNLRLFVRLSCCVQHLFSHHCKEKIPFLSLALFVVQVCRRCCISAPLCDRYCWYRVHRTSSGNIQQKLRISNCSDKKPAYMVASLCLF